jgi:hypothetical protein
MVSIIPWAQIPQCQWHCGIWLGHFCRKFKLRQMMQIQQCHWNKTMGSDPAMSMTLRDSLWHCRILYDTGGSSTKTIIGSHSLPSKGNHSKKKCISKHHIHIVIRKESLKPLWHAQRSHWHHCDTHRGVIDTTVICTAKSLTPLWLFTSSLWGSGYL